MINRVISEQNSCNVFYASVPTFLSLCVKSIHPYGAMSFVITICLKKSFLRGRKRPILIVLDSCDFVVFQSK